MTGLVEEPAQEPQVGTNAEHPRLGERASQSLDGVRAAPAVSDELGQHRVIPIADGDPGAGRGVDADAVGPGNQREHSAGGQEAGFGVLGVEASLDRVAVHGWRRSQAELLECRAPGHEDLVGDEVAAGDRFRDRVLHLEPCVHLQEVRLAVVGEQHLDRPGPAVADRAGDSERHLAHPPTELGRHPRGGRLLDDLLVATLAAAVALAEMDPLAVGVEQDLDLDVPRPREEALEDQAVIAERPSRLPACPGQRIGEVVGVMDDAHSLAAPARRRLDEQRKADLSCRLGQCRVALVIAVVARQHRHPELGGAPSRGGLVAHRRDRLGRRTDPGQPGGNGGARELRVLGQEPVPRVDRLDPGGAGDGQDLAAVEIAGDLVGFNGAIRRRLVGGVNGDDPKPHAARGPRDANGDLASVGDEDGSDRRLWRAGDG